MASKIDQLVWKFAYCILLQSVFVETQQHVKNTITVIYHKMTSQEIYKYRRLRDIHFPNISSRYEYPMKLPMFIIVKILSDSLNSTDMETYFWEDPKAWAILKSQKVQNFNKTIIFPDMAQFTFEIFSPFFQYERFLATKQKPIFVPISARQWNFAYCDLPRWKKESLWSMHVFTNVFDKEIWTFLISAMLTMSCTLGIKQFETNLLLLLSAILSGGLCGEPSRKHISFVIWLFFVRILVDLYSGEVSSRIISPPEENSLETTWDVYNANYSAVSRDPIEAVRAFNFLTRISSTAKFKWVNMDLVYMAKMFERTTIVSQKSATYEDAAKFVLKNHARKPVFWSYWYRTMDVAGVIQKTQESSNEKDVRQVVCHLGKEPVPAGQFYWGFFPPHGQKLAKVFAKLVESGIFDRLEREMTMQTYSRRVQDRSRFLSKTEMKKRSAENGKNAESYAQPLEVKMIKVFLIWGLAIGMNTVFFFMEYVYGCRKKIKFGKFNKQKKQRNQIWLPPDLEFLP